MCGGCCRPWQRVNNVTSGDDKRPPRSDNTSGSAGLPASSSSPGSTAIVHPDLICSAKTVFLSLFKIITQEQKGEIGPIFHTCPDTNLGCPPWNRSWCIDPLLRLRVWVIDVCKKATVVLNLELLFAATSVCKARQSVTSSLLIFLILSCRWLLLHKQLVFF